MLIITDRLLARPNSQGLEQTLTDWDRLAVMGFMHPAAKGSIYTRFHQLTRVQGHRRALSRYSPARTPPLSLGRAKSMPAWQGCRRGSAGAAPVPIPIDSHLLLIGADSSSGVRKEEAQFPRPRCPMRGPKPSGILPSSQQGSKHGRCWGPLVHLLPQRANGHGKTRLGRAGRCLGAPGASEMEKVLRAPSSIAGDSSLQCF